MAVERPALPLRTQYDEDITLSSARRSGSLYTAQATSLEAFEETVTLPLSLLPEGVTASVSALTGVTVTVEDALLFSAAVRNHPDFAAQEGVQALALRDRLYLFERTRPDAQPFSVQARVQDGGIQFVISADAGLTPGYYRLCLSADYAMGAAEWDTPAWVEEKNLTITNEQVVLWEAFTGLMTRYDRDCDLVPRMFQHAWGPATDSTYHGAAYPDAPQVWQAPGLSELVRQIQLSANVERTPCLRFVFDVFVTR